MALMFRSDTGDKVPALRQMLHSRGLDARDFDIEEDSRSGISQLLGLAGGIITLRRRSTGEIRVYAAGPGSAWYAAIVSDLDRGYFKNAAPTSAFLRRTPPSTSALWV
jgi:hypothetical protein